MSEKDKKIAEAAKSVKRLLNYRKGGTRGVVITLDERRAMDGFLDQIVALVDSQAK